RRHRRWREPAGQWPGVVHSAERGWRRHPRGARQGDRQRRLRLDGAQASSPQPGGNLPAAHHHRCAFRRGGPMSNLWAVAQRELRSYFLSPLAYVVIALFLALAGYLFALILANGRQASIQGLVQNVSVLYLFIVPAISMRLLAEEQRTGTIELLLTNPVQEWEIVTGKFLASVLLVVVMLALTLLYPLFLFVFGSPDSGPMITGYLGILLQAAAFLSVGLWASSLTSNQIVAALIAFALLLILWLSDNLGQFLGGTVGSIVSYTSVINHFQSFPQGVIQTTDVIYYVTLIVAGIVLSTLSLQSRRLR